MPSSATALCQTPKKRLQTARAAVRPSATADAARPAPRTASPPRPDARNRCGASAVRHNPSLIVERNARGRKAVKGQAFKAVSNKDNVGLKLLFVSVGVRHQDGTHGAVPAFKGLKLHAAAKLCSLFKSKRQIRRSCAQFSYRPFCMLAEKLGI